ncbi:bacterial regulatory s, tetR family protein [Acinetobacter baumannii 541915]|uniref:multidrug efflux transcriptional repressor AdeN n=1 Tax=Acinetobacter baumannii TaxID=470 RepID=UPI000451F519|nr:multidrug efflux transcriptional repressor AdeN [Acinetobacter baumannii]EXR80733.1 bacterial regulatory s, tetR family protein [Acinetobacter baumannii 541915]
MHDPVLESHHLVCGKPQTRRGIERRLALLLSATELFLEKGYDAVSLDDIVNHAGGSKTSIYKYFGNKDGLFTAICDYRREMFFKDICIAFQPEQTSLKDYLIQTLIRFYKHIIQPEHIAFLRLVIEQTQCNATLSQYLYEKCALDVQNTIAQALLISHQSGEITCTSPDHSSLMYFGILRDIEWRMIMGMPLPPNETEVIDYINYYGVATWL